MGLKQSQCVSEAGLKFLVLLPQAPDFCVITGVCHHTELGKKFVILFYIFKVFNLCIGSGGGMHATAHAEGKEEPEEAAFYHVDPKYRPQVAALAQAPLPAEPALEGI